ncbi:MAG: hypothetical protein KDD64_15825, partial [Bdellovibrionales bacterium]|nr:hypothetical protein [Bdellovibrionales bacterium]
GDGSVRGLLAVNGIGITSHSRMQFSLKEEYPKEKEEIQEISKKSALKEYPLKSESSSRKIAQLDGGIVTPQALDLPQD